MYVRPQEDRPRVLIVDNDADTVEVTALLFEQRGAVVDAAYDGRMAIEHARAASPDLIMVDLALPHVDGFGVVQALRNPPLPTEPTIVAVSWVARDADKARCAEAGFDLHLTKPVNFDVLEQLLDSRRGSYALLDRFHQLSGAHAVACRDLIFARSDMAGMLIQTARTTTVPDTAARCLANAHKAHDAIATMLTRNIAWTAQDRSKLEQLLAMLREALRL
jgi:CheY-like chemotaxis protein